MLDLGGETDGFGPALIAQTAAEVSVLGGGHNPLPQRAETDLPNLRIVSGDPSKLPFPDSSLDLVMCAEQVRLGGQPDRVAKEVKRVLAPGGLFLVALDPAAALSGASSLAERLGKHWSSSRLTGVGIAAVSAAFALGQARSSANLAAATTFVRRSGGSEPEVVNDELTLATTQLVVAAFSDGPLDGSTFDASVLISPVESSSAVWRSIETPEDDLLTGEMGENKAVTARLLSRLTGQPVRTDVPSMIDALFALNEQLVTQRNRLEQAEEARQRAEALEHELQVLSREQRALQDRAEDAERRADALDRELRAEREEKDNEAGQMRTLLEEERQTRERSLTQRLQQELDRLRTEIEAERAGLEEAHRRAEEAREAELQDWKAEFEKAERERLEAERNREMEQWQKRFDDERIRTQRDRDHEVALWSQRLREEQEHAATQIGRLREDAARLDAERIRIQQDREQEVALWSARLREEQEQAAAQIAQLQEEQARLAAELRNSELQRQESERASESRKAQASAATIASRQAEDRRRRARRRLTSAFERQSSLLSAVHARVRAELAAAQGITARLPEQTAPHTGPLDKLKRRLLRKGQYPRTSLLDLGWVSSCLEQGRNLRASDYWSDPSLFAVSPHPLFDAAAYLEAWPDVREAGISPLLHYLVHGWREGRSPHPYFASEWYLAQYPDVLDSGLNPLEHYLEYGWKEGRKPNPAFDPQAYLERHPDVRDAGMEPLTHYVAYGRSEGREVPVAGLGDEWRFIAGDHSEENLLDQLLFGVLPHQDSPDEGTGDGPWKPVPLNDFWLPQTLRDMLLDSGREAVIPTYTYLYSVMAAYTDRPEEFPSSQDAVAILQRVKARSRARAQAAASTDDPLSASIIVPVYNNFLDTLLCLSAIFEIDSEHSFEVIVADDCSPDSSAALWSSIGGVVRHVRHPRNLGFLGNCNAAAEVANGEILVLLNNDTLVLPEWLDALLQTFSDHEKVGLAGSKLINWDGTLQEAGGIFWKDASAWNFGRGSDALAPEFNYMKEVDYVSGASIAVPEEIWREMGGFDPIYTPAYCEDSDLAFRLRKAGYRTLYQPRSEVIHHEGRSHGRDTGSGIKAYQVANQERLATRWGEVLQAEHYSNAQNVFRARDRSGGRPHLLVIDHYVPKWDNDAGSRTIYQYIEIFLELGFQITFWPDNLHRDPVYATTLQSMGVEVIYGVRFRDEFEQFVRERADLYDAVFLSRPHVAIRYLPHIRAHTRARTLFYGHDLHFRRMEVARQLGEPIEEQSIEAMRQQELEVCRMSDVIFYPDPDEVKAIQAEVGPGHQAFANPVFVYEDAEVANARGRLPAILEPSGDRLLFVGGFNHTPNGDGIIWFVHEVMPLIAARIPGVRLDVAGSNPTAAVEALASDRVAVLGRVSDEQLSELYDGAAVAVAPLRVGAGVKGKVIEAMALAVPVATTPIGAQGIPGGEQCLFIGKTAEDLADAVVIAIRDRAEAQRRAERAIEVIEQHYGRRSLSELFRRLI